MTVKFLTGCSISLLLCVGIQGQETRPDSVLQIERELRALTADVRLHASSLLPRVEELAALSDQTGDLKIRIMSLLIAGRGYESLKQYDEAYAYIDEAFAIAEENDYRKQDYMLNYTKGFTLIQQGENEKALPYIYKCLDVSNAAGNDTSRAQAFSHLGYVYTKMADFDNALIYLDSASQLFQELDDEVGLQRHYGAMGVYYARVGDREKGLAESLKALELSIKRQDTAWMIVNHLNVLGTYAVMGDIERALYHYEERSALIELIDYPEDRKVDLNIGVLYVQSGQFERALEVLNYCSDYYKREKNLQRVALIDHWKAIAYRGLDRYDLAATSSIRAYEAATEVGDRKLAELSAYTLFQTYNWRGRDSEAIKWLITSEAIKDSISDEARQKEMLELETKYQTMRKEQEIEMLTAKNALERTKRIMLTLVLIVAVVIGGAIIYSQRLKRRKDREVNEERVKRAELEQRRLEDRLRYKEKELASQLLQTAKKNEFLSHIKGELETIKKAEATGTRHALGKVVRTISHDMSDDDSWEQFLASFKEVHQSFTETMMEQYKLSPTELRLASMMKMNMSSKEIASLLNITDDGVKKSRYRLRKKLGLPSDVNIQEYLIGIT